ncbi:MAG: bifunctional aldolase/short-chain dehydrogenase [Deltaproteobacteria bacterium]|nr:bifunctional aldolase/short-chain dehydrogenase [Deltaproteobacteria bacterium]
MKNRYDAIEAQRFINSYPDQPEGLCLRVYTSRLIGGEEDLVLHGGGNTSVKCRVPDLFGEEKDIIFVKGSGWDLGDIEPQGFPGLDLAYLRRLRGLPGLSDEEMVNQFRTHLVNASSPNPSIETLVHAFLPHTFIDHTHADAIVTLTNLDNCETLLRDVLGESIGILPFIMPGFPLAQAVADLYEKKPEMDCLILRHHGIFTFGDDAKTAYDRMIRYVSLAENFLAGCAGNKPTSGISLACPDTDTVLPLIRGAMSHTTKEQQTFHLHLRQNDKILAALARPDAREMLVSGVLTPDHVIRTKNYPLFLDLAGIGAEPDIARHMAAEFAAYETRYHDYFTKQLAAKKVQRAELDPKPRVILIRGLGLVTAGETPKDALIAADIAEHTISAKTQGAAIGPYRELDEATIFDMEYWSLEQAKLGKGKKPLLAGKIALVTGGGGAIACGIGRKLLEAGARIFLTDINQQRLDQVCALLAGSFGKTMVSALPMDVTDSRSVQECFSRLIREAGGLDILVPNAGIAHVAKLQELDEQAFHKVLEVNLMGVFQVIKGAIPIFTRQATGGNVIINSSKNVFAPGESFGAYSASKAGAHQLGKIAALELAPIKVRVNMINADAIFDDAGVSSGLWDVVGPDRMKARNLDPAGLKEYYRQRNLLKTEVLADHVGNGVVFFAGNLTPTTGATLPVDGGIMAAFPR